MAGKFKDFGKKMADAAKSTAKKSEELIEIGKVKGKIKDEEHKIEKLKMQIGEMAYTKFTDGQETFPEAAEFCGSIVESLEAISGFEDQILELKHIRVCPECETDVDDEVAFCSKCGHKFEVIVKEDEEPEEPEGNVCAACGVAMEDGAAFCGACGAKTE